MKLPLLISRLNDISACLKQKKKATHLPKKFPHNMTHIPKETEIHHKTPKKTSCS